MTPAELIAALRAALDAEEATALDATFEDTHPAGNHWQWGEIGNVPAPAVRDGYLRSNGGLSPTASLITVETYPEDGHDFPAEVLRNANRVYEGVARHIVGHDPARVLADIAAKRTILDLHQQREPGWCETCNVPGDVKGSEHGCPTVLALAAAYGIHA